MISILLYTVCTSENFATDNASSKVKTLQNLSLCFYCCNSVSHYQGNGVKLTKATLMLAHVNFSLCTFSILMKSWNLRNFHGSFYPIGVLTFCVVTMCVTHVISFHITSLCGPFAAAELAHTLV